MLLVRDCVSTVNILANYKILKPYSGAVVSTHGQDNVTESAGLIASLSNYLKCNNSIITTVASHFVNRCVWLFSMAWIWTDLTTTLEMDTVYHQQCVMTFTGRQTARSLFIVNMPKVQQNYMQSHSVQRKQSNYSQKYKIKNLSSNKHSRNSIEI